MGCNMLMNKITSGEHISRLYPSYFRNGKYICLFSQIHWEAYYMMPLISQAFYNLFMNRFDTGRPGMKLLSLLSFNT